MPITPAPDIERFEGRFIPEPNSGCWLWTGATGGTSGYGKFYDTQTRRNLWAHRASWVLHCGPIPDGMLVLHKCDVRVCVNPDHLFLGTYVDNVADMIAKGRDRNYKRQQTHCKFGHELTQENMYRHRDRRRCKICADRTSKEWRIANNSPKQLTKETR
jgi:hypothetical protein